MRHTDNCETEILAEMPHSAVTLCRKCRNYHVHVGPVSLRLGPEAFNELCTLIADVSERGYFRDAESVPLMRDH